jgi:hypothetical protein
MTDDVIRLTENVTRFTDYVKSLTADVTSKIDPLPTPNRKKPGR